MLAGRKAPTVVSSSELELVTSTRGFCALRAAWERLNAQAPSTSVFNTWLWHFGWWEQHGPARALKILVARRGGEVSAIVPLYVERSSGLRVLRLLGTQTRENPYNITPLFERSANAASARRVAQALVAIRGYDVLDLADLEASTPLTVALPAAAHAAGLRFEVERTRRALHLPLPASWNEYLRSLSSAQRARLRHRRHALLAAHATDSFLWEAGLDAMADALAMLRRMRSPALPTRPWVQRATLAEAVQDGRLRLHCLQVDGAIAALICAIRLRERVVVMQADLDPRYAPWHPISVLLQQAIQRAIDEGATGFDFLCDHEDFDDLAATEQMRITVFQSAMAAAMFRAHEIFAHQAAAAPR
jgi:CelD/BcsL family acetyltransferase involved in cellulose biosynthesis